MSSAVLAEISEGWIRRPSSSEANGYSARVVGRGDHQLDIELTQAGLTARTWIALPESLRPTPWLVESEPEDEPESWIQQLVEWLDEEMQRAGWAPLTLECRPAHRPASWSTGTGSGRPTRSGISNRAEWLVPMAGTQHIDGA